jgi:hypothetical protein
MNQRGFQPTHAGLVGSPATNWTQSFDFIALRLRPQCSQRAMKPVRIITPGADPTLPLRMVAAGWAR